MRVEIWTVSMTRYLSFSIITYLRHTAGGLREKTPAFPMDYWIDWIRLYQKPGLGDLYVVG